MGTYRSAEIYDEEDIVDIQRRVLSIERLNWGVLEGLDYVLIPVEVELSAVEEHAVQSMLHKVFAVVRSIFKTPSNIFKTNEDVYGRDGAIMVIVYNIGQ